MKILRTPSTFRHQLMAGFLSLSLCIFCISSPLFSYAKPVPLTKPSGLQKGVNLFDWFAGPHVTQAGHQQRYMTDADMDTLKAMGFDHVRLPVNPDLLVLNWNTGEYNPAGLRALDEALGRLQAHHLKVVLDMHASDWNGFKKRLFESDTSVAQLASLWTFLAKRYSGTSPDQLYFEVLNEPHFNVYTDKDSAKICWLSVQTTLIQAIRSGAPNHPVVVTGYDWDSLNSLKEMEPLPFPKLIYTFHFYEPMLFTHQGATWLKDKPVKVTRNLRFQPDPAQCKALLNQSTDSSVLGAYQRYCLSGNGPARIERQFQTAATWARKNRVPLYLGEYGVIRETSPPSDRERWLHIVRTVAERHGIGWAMWDYKTNFGLIAHPRD